MTFAKYNERPFVAKARIINPGIKYIYFCFCSIKSCLIAGSSKYATYEVLPAKRTVKNTEIKIFLIYFFV